ncbi:PLP-dependent transferase [Yimella sp. cx-573]|nr:PLP-dependent transferase [Yimella sp. cx-573]
MNHDPLSPATRIVAAGRPSRVPGAAVGPSVEFTSTFVTGGDNAYARFDNPTWRAFEEAIGALEHGSALAFASGMGAIRAAIELVPLGGAVLVPQHSYNGTTALLDKLAEAGRLRVTRADVSDTPAYIDALDHTDLAWVESPTNPMLEVADLPNLFKAARESRVLTVCDNTFATPLLQQPLTLGADVVVHSATKYLSGHSDLIMGVTVTADPQIQQRLHSERTLSGAIAGPMEAWLALRGMRTLHVRFERACANAAELAARLADHPQVEAVRYPGSGAMLAIDVRGGVGAAEAVEQAVQLWLPATSLGGVESMLERRRRHTSEPMTVPENLLRLSVGIEDVEDLWRDLDAALSSSRAS